MTVVIGAQVDRFRGLKEFPKVAAQVMAGSKPCFAFAGQEFETKPEYKLLKVSRRQMLKADAWLPAFVRGL